MDPGRGVSVVLAPLANILNAKKSLNNLKVIYFSTAQVFNGATEDATLSDISGISPNNYYGYFMLLVKE